MGFPIGIGSIGSGGPWGELPPNIPGVGGSSTGFPFPTPTSGPNPPSGGSIWSQIFTPQNILGLAGLVTGTLGSVLNRPKGLSGAQRKLLDQLLATLSAKANAPLSVDPTARNALFEQIAQSAQGARNRVGNDFAARGLGQSGLYGEELGRVERAAAGAQTAGTAQLLEQSRAERQNAQAQLQSLLLGVPSLQGASASGTALSSIGEVLGYLYALNRFGQGSGNTGNAGTTNLLPFLIASGRG